MLSQWTLGRARGFQTLLREDADEYFCRMMMHEARFEPAPDAQGVPVAGLFSTSISFQNFR